MKEPMKEPYWEYHLLVSKLDDSETLSKTADMLNEMGKKGWTVLQCSGDGRGVIWTLARYVDPRAPARPE